MSNNEIHLGVVGLGNWSRQIFLAVDRLPDVRITHCYSRHSDTRGAFAAEYGCKACARHRELLDDDGLDGVVVMSANTAHEDDVIRAASNGKHVFVTKPIATTLAAARRMIDVCARNHVVLAVEHQTRREPALRKLKEILASGALGDVRLVEANYCTPTGLKIAEGDWRGREGECPGGTLIQIGIHVIDALQYLFGRVSRVLSWQDSKGLQVEMPCVTATLLDFESGLRGYLGSTYLSSFSHWIRVYGTKKNAVYNELGGLTLTADSWEDGEVHEAVAPAADVTAPMPAVVEQMAEFARCIRTGERPETDGENGLRNLAVVLAAVESARTGNPASTASPAARDPLESR